LRHTDELTPMQTRLLYFIFSQAAVAIQNASQARGVAALKDFFSGLLEDAGDIIFAVDRRGRFTYANAGIEELGVRKNELVGQAFQTIFKRAEVAKRINSTLMQGTRQVFDLELTTRVSRPQQYTVHLAPLREAEGERTGALGIMRNVTELSRLQKKLLESERLAAYTQTVITLNHEINNPLTTVMGNLFLLEKEAQKYDDEKIISRLNVIQANCQRIQNVIKKLERIEELKTIPYLGGTKMVDIRGSSEDTNG
jgi:PAS domain S-box-containing protein